MATQATRQEFNRFVKGLFTEASLLNMPPDVAQDILNFDLDAKGIAKRRPGLDHETLNTWRSIYGSLNLNTDVVQVYKWDNVAGVAGKTFIVVQVARWLSFFTNVSSDFSINYVSGLNYNIAAHRVGTSAATDVDQNPISFTSGNGKLYINHKYLPTIEVVHDVSGATNTYNVEEVKIRDFDGLDDGFDVAEQPDGASINNAHWYNLSNQGWENRQTELAAIVSGRGTYPSNAEQWQYGKYIAVASGIEAFSYTHYEKQEFGNTLAPRGHFIIDAFDKNVTSFPSSLAGAVNVTAGTATTLNIQVTNHGLNSLDTIDITGSSNATYDNGGGCPGINVVLNGTGIVVTKVDANNFTIPVTTGSWVAWCTFPTDGTWVKTSTASSTNALDTRTQANAFYAGRLFQAGIEEDGLDGSVYFSRIITGDNQFYKCYQDADPTAEHSNELVATDGGVIAIPDMKLVHKMEPFGSGILIFASNGIWFLYGGETDFFTSNSFSVRKLSSVGVISNRSMVMAENTPHFWSKEGIYRVVQDDVSALPKIESMTANTIQTFYDNIDDDYGKPSAKGAYNDLTKKIHWVYSDGSDNSFYLSLVYDLRTGGFFPFEYDTGEGYTILDVVQMPDIRTYKEQKVKYIIYRDSDGNIGGSDLSDQDSYDWTNADAPGYIETSDLQVLSPSTEVQLKQLTMYFNRTEENWIDDGSGGATPDFPSSCLFTPYWDWTDHANAGKIGTQREVYRHRRVYVGVIGTAFDSGYPVVMTKNKVRGSGRTVRFRFDTTAGKRCEILGWTSTFETRDVE